MRPRGVASVDLGDQRLDARAAVLLSSLGNRLAEPRQEAADWLIRACQDRALQAGVPPQAARRQRRHARLRQTLLATPVLYEAGLLIRGREAKTAVCWSAKTIRPRARRRWSGSW